MNKLAKEGFNEILLYTTPNGKVDIYLQDETVWLTQQKIADLFGVDRTWLQSTWQIFTKRMN